MKKHSDTSQCGFLGPRMLLALLVCTGISCLLASLDGEVPAKAALRPLGFAERVSYQRVIEEVYWRHRIWPKERPDPKPSLDTVMTQSQLEEKVKDYLRKSQALEDYWHRPITADQLQAEMKRMAQHTRQPEVLLELFEALGNDPFVIAECLVRPALAERLLTNWYAFDQRIHGKLKQRAQANLLAHRTIEQMTSGAYSEIELIKNDSSKIGQDRDAKAIRLNSREWNESVQKLAATFNNDDAAKGAWLGLPRKVAAFQSTDASPQSKIAAEMYKILPVGKLSRLQEDETRYYVTAVVSKRTGHLKPATVSWLKEPLGSWLARAENRVREEIPIQSGNYVLPGISEGASGCFDDTWTTTAGPPDGREGHTAVWTGSEMIVWGGYVYGSYYWFDTGGRYNPSTDSWTATSRVNAPVARSNHTAVWTGREMIVWGGETSPYPTTLNTGGRYNPNTDSWTATSTTNAPSGRYWHTAVWSGVEMVVWGGVDSDQNGVNTGGRYNPGMNTWTASGTTNAPAARFLHTAVWSGNAMIVWGGVGASLNDLNTGGSYNPRTDGWTAINIANTPIARSGHKAVWTGNEMLVWGGTHMRAFMNTGGRYNPGTNNWMSTSTANAPEGRINHTAAWTGSEMIVWGGFGESFSYFNTGGRYNPSTDSWISTGMNNAPPAGVYPTSVWTGTDMIVWGGASAFGDRHNNGAKYNPGTDSWAATSLVNAPEGRENHTAIWTGTEMIVWGGYPSLNTGGRYDPGSDNWAPTSTVNAPTGRYNHTAVWTGSEMTVWGGYNDNAGSLNSGGRYNPATNTWINTTIVNAPAARELHTAIWTGSDMIVWGGTPDEVNYLNTGGRYNPDRDNWAATSTANAPSGRSAHTGVWTGSQMIVWGGQSALSNFVNTGGMYDPNADRWLATSTNNAPEGRGFHTAVWTTSEMIIWGGVSDADVLGTGGRYKPRGNSWTATSTANAPTARFGHTAIWTGNEMIVWGGLLSRFNVVTGTGSRYCAPGPSTQLGNISTRAFVQTGDNVMVGGFIVQGTGPKRVIIRAIGPELIPYGVPNALANPTLELHNATGTLMGSNDDWQQTIIGGVITANQVSQIQNSGHAPTAASESAIIADLPPGSYTAIVRGVNNMTGVALVEVYDLGADISSILGNISTRSFVQTGADVMIGGFIIQGTGAKRVIIRAIGPELTQYGVPDALANPTLELHNAGGALIASNNNWATTIIGGIISASQVRDIQASGHAPGDPRESAIVADLPAGNYTAIVRGVNDTIGVALVEVYDLD